MGLLNRIRDAQAKRAWGVITEGMNAAHQSWDDAVLDLVAGSPAALFLGAKWPGFTEVDDSGTLRASEMRPRTVDDVASMMSLSAAQVREIDAEVSRSFQPLLGEMNDLYRKVFAWLQMPIDDAQAWWDERMSKLFYANGDSKWHCKYCDQDSPGPRPGTTGNLPAPCVNCGKNLKDF